MTGKGPPSPSACGTIRSVRRLGCRGATASEFALIAIPFFITIIMLMEACWQLATGAALDHASLKASRFGATGSTQVPVWQRGNTPDAELPASRADAIKWLVRRSTGGLIRPDSSLLTVTTQSFGGLGAITPLDNEAGGSGAIVAYTIRYRQPFISGDIAARFWGGNGITHETTIVIKNEPFENASGLGG